MTETQRIFAMFTTIAIIDQLAGTMFEQQMPRGMTQAQFGILNHFVRLGLSEESPAQLAADFQVTRPTMTSTLARLERAGMVAIRRHPTDGRGKLVSITEAGRAMRARCVEATSGLLPLLSEIVSADELETIQPVLDRLQQGLDRHRRQ